MSKAHIVLLGDSIFDNAVYVGSKGKSVVQHLQNKIPTGWNATLCAIDGAVIKGVSRQISTIPKDATHLFLSIGGNNALGFQTILFSQVSTVGEALLSLGGIQEQFRKDYHSLLESLVNLKLPLTVCNIYNPNYEEKQLKVAKAGLCLLNDVIMSEAALFGLPMIDIKTLFNDKEDYANPIEPSTQGGDKLSDVIIKVVKNHNYQNKITSIYI